MKKVGLNNIYIQLTRGRRRYCFRKDHFSKQQHLDDGSFHMVECINDNAYKLELPIKYSVTLSFNATICLLLIQVMIWDNSFQEEGSDSNQGVEHGHKCWNGAKHAQGSVSLLSGLIMRLNAKCFMQTLNRPIQENWADYENELQDGCIWYSRLHPCHRRICWSWLAYKKNVTLIIRSLMEKKL